jgi:subtilisin family serine protease
LEPGTKSQGRPILELVHRADDPLNGANEIRMVTVGNGPQFEFNVPITIRFMKHLSKDRAGATPKAYSPPARADGKSDADSIRFDAWIGFNDEVRSASFVEHESYQDRTISSIACGPSTLSVGSVDSSQLNDLRLDFESSIGPTRIGRAKPEVAAPGVAVRAHALPAGSAVLTSVFAPKSGTSVATPIVGGVIARMFDEAGSLRMPIAVTRELVTKASRLPPKIDSSQRVYVGSGVVRDDGGIVGASGWGELAALLRDPERIRNSMAKRRATSAESS